MELDSNILQCLTVGDRVVIRGDKEDGAVLCTLDKTYDIKEAETSNSLLIIPDLKFSQDLPSEGDVHLTFNQVTSVLQTYYELRPCKPKLKKLKEVLERNPYSGKECENDEHHQGKKYTLNDLLDTIQASESEILQALHQFKACHIDGYWRLLEFDFLTQVLNHVLQLIDENDWLDSGIPLEECCQTLQDLFPRCVISHVVETYCDKNTTSDAVVYKISEDRVCRFFAELLLRGSGQFNYKEFLEVWQQSVPEGMKTDTSQLEGLALTNLDCNIPVIWHFPVEDLPEDIQERFEFLFKTREKWTRDDITPYIKDLTTEKLDVGALLTRYARASMQNGIKVFNSRKQVTK
ncbi:hypothetical protein LOTGIDRAFT_208569 [Lottia gigantea]|uniref:Sister chromatid cohesion protein DCC1 n=1 Tax=Lottia gigantea TaxID=225164 RepID=V4BI22_LOTGI|nr:hypothetical protein LOTGIDRAFT_208569 [Lottia gigantea]ESP05567.1 hypothetical protein LOTGIDRAFT_208569 [Lottia gigantea]